MEPEASCDTIYSQLPLSVKVHGNEIGLKPIKKTGFTTAFLEQNLPVKKLQQGEGDLKHKVEFLDIQKRKRKLKEVCARKKTLSNKDRKRLHLYKINKYGQRYEDYLAMHELWKCYMGELIDFSKLDKKSEDNAALKVLKADLHGSILTVERSKCASYVGTSGIVLKESRNTFTIIKADNSVKEVPKANSIFILTVKGYQFTIHGNHFRVRSAERSSRSFKSKATVDL